jgi:pSer/pThr/pTyr-binding forkhead associated (FHA) protein
VLQDSGISRRHAVLRPAGEGWELEDLGSTNGLLLNGRELRGSHPLVAGDVIEMGSTAIVFELG